MGWGGGGGEMNAAFHSAGIGCTSMGTAAHSVIVLVRSVINGSMRRMRAQFKFQTRIIICKL